MKQLRAIFIAALGCLMLAPSAFALSCMAPDIERELEEAIKSDKLYHIFVGNFTAPQIKRPDIGGNHPHIMRERTMSVSGMFTGYSLAKNRRDDFHLTDYPVTITSSCAAHWCGQVPRRDQKMIVFVEAQEAAPPVLTMGPCPYFTHAYAPDKIETLRRGL